MTTAAPQCPAHRPSSDTESSAHRFPVPTPPRWSTGRRAVIASLSDDPFWPTRKPLRASFSLLTGWGRDRPIPPGPIGLPFIGSAIPMARNPYKFLQDCHRRYGDIYRVPLPIHPLVLANHPDLVSEFMENTELKYSMSAPIQGRRLQKAVTSVGCPVQVLEGQALRDRRKRLMPMFGKRHLSVVSNKFVEVFTDRIDRWLLVADTGKEVNLQAELPKVVLPAFMYAMFSTRLSDDEVLHADTATRSVMRAIASGLFLASPPNIFPLRGRENLPVSGLRLMRTIRQMIRDRRANPTDDADLLNILLAARGDSSRPLTEIDVYSEIMSAIGGGYETIVASMSWTLALLLQYPEHLDRLYDEISILNGDTPTPDDLPRLPWARACFDEGQRLQGAPINPRYAMEDTELGGYPIPKYTLVASSLYVVHRDPRWWGENAETYDPMQFFDQDRVNARPRLAFQAFGAGPHHCMGTGMAYMMAQYLLAIIFQRYRLHLRPGWQPRQFFSLSTLVKGGVPATITKA